MFGCHFYNIDRYQVATASRFGRFYACQLSTSELLDIFNAWSADDTVCNVHCLHLSGPSAAHHRHGGKDKNVDETTMSERPARRVTKRANLSAIIQDFEKMTSYWTRYRGIVPCFCDCWRMVCCPFHAEGRDDIQVIWHAHDTFKKWSFTWIYFGIWKLKYPTQDKTHG